MSNLNDLNAATIMIKRTHYGNWISKIVTCIRRSVELNTRTRGRGEKGKENIHQSTSSMPLLLCPPPREGAEGDG